MFPLIERTFLRMLLHWKWLAYPTTVGAQALVECDGKFLLVRPSYSRGWHLPGGGVERGETPDRALLRELEEEIGLKTCLPPQLERVYTYKAGLVTCINILYRINEAHYDFKPNWEIRAVCFVDPDNPPEDVGQRTLQWLRECKRCAAAP